MKRFNVLLLCTAGALTSFSTFAAFLQPGKITAGSDMTFILMNICKTTNRPVLILSFSPVWLKPLAVRR